MATAVLTGVLLGGCVGLVVEWIYSVLKDRKDAQSADLPDDLPEDRS